MHPGNRVGETVSGLDVDLLALFVLWMSTWGVYGEGSRSVIEVAVDGMPGRSGVGETALGAEMMRAEEGNRADRLFEDPLAAAFLAAAPDPFPDGPDPDDPQIAELKGAFQTNVAVRT